MSSSKFILFEETLKGFIDYNSGKIMTALKRTLKESDYLPVSTLKDFSSEIMANALFRDVLKCMFNESGKNCIPANPEETVAELIRNGIPKECVSAGFRHVTADLPNGSYRLYRLTSAYPTGSVRISRGESEVVILTGYSPKEMAEFILLLDPLLPKIDEAAETLYRDMNREIVRRQAEIKALEIAKQAVEAQLAEVLPGLGISCKFKITDDMVHLDLARLFKAGIDIPLAELSNLLSTPEKIESALKAVPATE